MKHTKKNPEPVKSKSYKQGEYYKINLVRGNWPNAEYFNIGVGLRGQIVSCEYDHGQGLQNIRQYNDMDGEAFYRQMVEIADPAWREI